jgi:hypothetical protein
MVNCSLDKRVDGGQARMAHPSAADTQPGYPSLAVAAVPARSTAADEQAIADRRESGPENQPRSQHQQVGRGHLRLHHMLPHLSGQGQRTGMQSACSRCDSYMKGFQPSRRGTAPDCVEIMECGCQEAADRVTGPPQRSP